jgi:hypothetical protein
MTPTPLKIVNPDEVAQRNALEMADELRARIVAGEVVRFGLIECRRGDLWATSFSSGMDKRHGAAMLIELGVKMLGFASQ